MAEHDWQMRGAIIDVSSCLSQISLLRFEAWNDIEEAARQMSRAAEPSVACTAQDERIQTALSRLKFIEGLMGFPGSDQFREIVSLYESGDYRGLHVAVHETSELLESGEYRQVVAERLLGRRDPDVLCFDLLVVGQMSASERARFQKDLEHWCSEHDPFVYNIVFVDSFEEAVAAALLNFDVQACVIHDEIAVGSNRSFAGFDLLMEPVHRYIDSLSEIPCAVSLARFLRAVRPEINLFQFTELAPERQAGSARSFFDRIFHRHEASSELHFSVIKAVSERYETPFFDAVKRYSRQPVGAFHALPIARGNSVFDSIWMRDFYQFYGADILLAESSATTGGLDSILQPTGTLKEAQDKASSAYGSHRTFFVTNGTSTANKIVHQALTRPGDIVLIDKAAHESHHFAFLLTGASPLYIDGYKLETYSISGGVQLQAIKRALVDLSEQGLLDRVKVVCLTNCTFDGLTYNVQRYMEEILAIKPDITFLWDEAWFAYARFAPLYRQRTGMYAAQALTERYDSEEYRADYEEYREQFLRHHPVAGDAWVDQRLLPDPDKVRVRVYVTQSTHKTLSCFRQGSMIHVHDALFHERVNDRFTKAYFTHTTTSPNYQILASLDVSRRQVELEGYKLVQRQIEMADLIRRTINGHPMISRYFHAITAEELIPNRCAPDEDLDNGHVMSESECRACADSWKLDDVVLDPCKINVYTAATGIDGFTLRTRYLADRFSIQVNKTGLNSFCLMTNVGTTRSSVAYLINCLVQISEECEKREQQSSEAQKQRFDQQRGRVTKLPPLPEVGRYHPMFRGDSQGLVGMPRDAFFAGYDACSVEYHSIDELAELLEEGVELVGATFIVPVPPGYPLIGPGQIITMDVIRFLKALNPAEILGLDPELGVRVFSQSFFQNDRQAERTTGIRQPLAAATSGNGNSQ